MRIRSVLLAGLLFSLLCGSAHADTLVTVPHPQAVWNSTLGQVVSLCPPGQNTCDPIVDTTGTQTLTNKTLTAPTINGGTLNNVATTGRAPNLCGATCTLTSANAGQATLLNTASGSVATLPAATGTGNVYLFIVSTAVSSNKDAILAASSTDALVGLIVGETSNTPKMFSGGGSTFHSLQMPFAGTQPSGGFLGDNFSCRDIAAAVWECTGSYAAGVTPTTPFNAATS